MIKKLRYIILFLVAVTSNASAFCNVPLHEWTTSIDTSNFEVMQGQRSLSGAEASETRGELSHKSPENLTTWIFEDGTFIPMAKLQSDKAYSIITDHLGTPTEAYDEKGEKVWNRQLNIYGETRRESGEKNFIPFLYQGQYLDTETELAYNRFRYYSPESGLYVSQDPVRLKGGDNFYAFVKDVNSWIDVLGLSGQITVVRLNASSPSGNHYALFYEKDGQSMMTDLLGADGENVTPRDRPNTKINLNDIPDADKKVIPVTGNLDDAIKRTKQQFKNKPYKLGKIDCYQYVESILRKANSSVSIKGSSNLDRFNSISCS